MSAPRCASVSCSVLLFPVGEKHRTSMLGAESGPRPGLESAAFCFGAGLRLTSGWHQVWVQKVLV